jgi:hypothetical protein
MISTITEIFDRRRSTFGGHGFCQAAGHPHANYSAATGYSQKKFQLLQRFRISLRFLLSTQVLEYQVSHYTKPPL